MTEEHRRLTHALTHSLTHPLTYPLTYVLWQACGAQPPGECNNTNIELMWNRWQARHLAPHRMPSGR